MVSERVVNQKAQGSIRDGEGDEWCESEGAGGFTR